MRFVIQRVSEAKVDIEGKTTGSIKKGLLVLVGIAEGDTENTCKKYVDKLAAMRIFEDSEGKTNLNLDQIGGELLVVSQFTLLASCKKGNRPGFSEAANPKKAEELYLYIVDLLKGKGIKVETGIFGAEMKVTLVNEGPFTIVLDL